MRTDCSNIYILSFNAGADAGLAAVSAYSERDAFQILKNSGRYNAIPNAYSLIQIIDLGLSTTIRTELLLEVYTNALGVFEAFIKYLNKYVGPKGDKGDPGDTTIIGAVQSDWLQVDTTQLDYIKNKPEMPTALSQLSSDSTHRTVTDQQISQWQAKSSFSGDYNDLINKPNIPAAQINADWNAETGVAQILNKPDISKFPKYELCETTEDYEDIANPQSDTFYCIPEDQPGSQI